MLEIIAHCREPYRINQFIPNLFEGIRILKLDDERKVRGMMSSNREFVEFLSVVDPILCKG